MSFSPPALSLSRVSQTIHTRTAFGNIFQKFQPSFVFVSALWAPEQPRLNFCINVLDFSSKPYIHFAESSIDCSEEFYLLFNTTVQSLTHKTP